MKELSVKELEEKRKELCEMYSFYTKIRDVGGRSRMDDGPEENGRKLDELLSSYEPVLEKGYHDLQLSFKRDPENVVHHLLGWFEIERGIIVKNIKMKSLKLKKFSAQIESGEGDLVAYEAFQEPMWGSRINEFLRCLVEARSDEHFISINGGGCGDVTLLSVLRDLKKLKYGSKSEALFDFLLRIPGATTKKMLVDGSHSLVFLEQLEHLISSINDVDKKALLMVGAESGFVD